MSSIAAFFLSLATLTLEAAAWRVIDGDTIEIDGERIRIAGIDTPETFRPQCDAERMLGEIAAAELAGRMQGRELELERLGTDRYGRTLANVRADGEDLGASLVRDGLAVVWEGRRHDWCS